MSKQATLVSGAVIIIILMVAGLTFALLKNSSVSTEQADVVTQNENTLPAENNKGTIQNLLTAGKNVTCEVSDPQQNSRGSIFISGGKFRGDFTTGHMIQSEGFSYFWNDGSKTGIKVNLSDAKTSTQSGQQPQTIDLSKEVEMDCSPWTADPAKFDLPDDVRFSNP